MTSIETTESPLCCSLAPTRSEWLRYALTAAIAFVASLVVYWLTVAPSASYWDCPEYILTAVRLEVGHPPGNPMWMLFHRVATAVSGPEHAALVVNMMSGLFTALAAGLLALSVAVTAGWWLRGRIGAHALIASAAGLCGGLMFAWCDSAWFSAVEAEVYAMSVFLTALAIWLMLRWTMLPAGSRADRLLLLNVYLMGLSLGVHQLNLLAFPCMAAIYVWRRRDGSCGRRLWGILLLSLVAVVCILKGMMPGTVWMACLAELMAVNRLGLHYGSGALAYLVLLFLAAAVAISSTQRRGVSSALRASALFPLLVLSGLFFLGRMIWLSLLLSAIASIWAGVSHISARRMSMTVWGILLLLTGYSSIALVLIRAQASPPINSGNPSDTFALYSYIEREQYGSKPLLRGRTPFSKPVAREEFGPDSRPDYRHIALKKEGPRYAPAIPGARLNHRSGYVTHADSACNRRILDSAADGYLLSDYSYSQITTPELDMWFPRITSGASDDISAYESWVGMDTSTMVRVAVSEAIDSAGRPVSRLDDFGRRPQRYSWRPSYLQNLQFLLGYQAGYMYFRYLLWNFSGRQNDLTSSGEADHGNFLTGISFADDAMLGQQSLLPREASAANRGHNLYYMLPLLLALAGIVALCIGGRSGRRICFGILLLFVMTGVAIVVYLNQEVGEPRERDYSFLGSFWAFAAWGGFGVAALALLCRRLADRFLHVQRARKVAVAAATILPVSVPLLMLAENYDDHDRSNRHAATDFACNILNSLAPDAVLFVDGDNYTFPLWYVQEVLGVRRDVRVLSLSYLTLPSYVVSQMQQGEQAPALAMNATPADLLYGRYSLCRIPQTRDSVLSPLADVLRATFASDSPVAALAARCARFEAGPDTVTIDFSDIATRAGGSQLGLRNLAVLDIVASNAGRLPVYWLGHLPDNTYAGLKDLTYPVLFGRRLRHAGDSTDDISSRPDFLRKMQWGGMNFSRPPYADPTVQSMVSFQRIALVRAGRRALEGGDAIGALAFAYAALNQLPDSVAPYGYSSSGGKIAWEGMELGLLLTDAGKAAGDQTAVKAGCDLLESEIRRFHGWHRYYKSLTPAMKNVVSYRTLRFLQVDLDSIATAGGLK